MHERTGSSHLFGRIRRLAGALTGWQDTRLDFEPIPGLCRPTVPRAVEPREGARGTPTSATEKAEQEIMMVRCSRVVVLVVGVIGCTSSAAAQNAATSPSTTRRHVETLASDTLDGRLHR